MTKKIIIGTIIIVSLITYGCSKSDDTSGGGNNSFTPDCTTARTFAADAQPVIQSSCAASISCHAAGSANGPGALTNYSQIFNARAAIRSAVASGRMPQGGTLSSAQKNAIICWIDAGAANN